jgi:hypothetical protein
VNQRPHFVAAARLPARLPVRAGYRVHVYDSEATPCSCVVGLFCGIPATPVEVEIAPRNGTWDTQDGERRCLMCGTCWRIEGNEWKPLQVRSCA